MTTPKEVAEWMVEELARVQFLHQQTVVWQISEKFGQEFTYTNENGNLAIDRRVLREFRKLTPDNVIWDKGERMWRCRQSYDQEGRQQ